MSSVVSICGCELNNPDPELFDSATEEKPEGHVHSDKCPPGTCWNCPFMTKCLWPSKRRCLIPKGCSVYELGREKAEGGDLITWFALKKGDRIVLFRMIEPPHQWAEIRRIKEEEEEVPSWAISKLRIHC